MWKLELKKELFTKLEKTYRKLLDETKMSDKEYSKLLEIWDKIIAIESEYWITEE